MTLVTSGWTSLKWRIFPATMVTRSMKTRTASSLAMGNFYPRGVMASMFVLL